MLEERELQAKILMSTRSLEYIESLGFNLEQERIRLDTILNGTFSKDGLLYKYSVNKKIAELESFLKDLKKYDEYFKLINQHELIRKLELNKQLSDEFISNIIEFIRSLRSCRFIIDDTQKKRVEEIYRTLYKIILKEILYSNDFDSKILAFIIEDEYDACMLNEIILKEIDELKSLSYLELSSYNLLKDNITFLKSQGIKNFARIEVVSKILACVYPDKLRERFNNDLSTLYEKINENQRDISLRRDLLGKILEKYKYIKDSLSKEKISKRLLPFLLTLSISLGIGSIGTKAVSELSKQKLYKTETTIFNSFTGLETTTESWQVELERSFIRNRIDYSQPFWSSSKGSYVINIETFDFTDRYKEESYEECLKKTSISSLRIDDEYKEITEEEALAILNNISTDYWVWAKEIIDTTQDKSEYKEEMDKNKFAILLADLYALLILALYVLDKKYKAGLYSRIKNLLEVIKTNRLAKKDCRFLSIEYKKALKECEDYIKDNQELNEIYQTTRREMLNTVGESYKDEQTILELISKIESKLDEIKPEDIKYSRKLGR